MGKRIYKEDAASIALLIYYKATNNNLLSYEKIKEFDKAIDEKLDEINSNFEYTYPLNNSDLIYFYSKDENDNAYLILKHDFNYDLAENKYILFPLDVYKAIISNDVLKTIGVEIKEGKLQKIQNKQVLKKTLK